MLRILFGGLFCLFLAGCLTSEPPAAATPAQLAARSTAAAPPPAADPGYPVIVTTMEVRLDDRIAGHAAVDRVLADARASVTITEFLPEQGVAVEPIRGARVEGTRTITEYARNTYRQLISTATYGAAILAYGETDPGWYVVHSYRSTAGFDPQQPRRGQRSCVVPGLALAPGVQPVELKPGDTVYFGHFVITIGPAAGSGIEVAEARIEAAPAGLDDMLRQAGLDPERVRRLPPENAPCPWSVPR